MIAILGGFLFEAYDRARHTTLGNSPRSYEQHRHAELGVLHQSVLALAHHDLVLVAARAPQHHLVAAFGCLQPERCRERSNGVDVRGLDRQVAQ
jgi:hypothetical protein